MSQQNITNSPNPSIWTSFTTTISGTSTAPTPGSGATLTSYYLQMGKMLFINMNFSQINAGSAGSGYYLFNLPTGFSINTSVSGVLSVGSPYSYPSAGSCIATLGNNSYDTGSVLVHSSSFYALALYNASLNSSFIIGNVGSGYYILGNAIVTYSATAMLPIN